MEKPVSSFAVLRRHFFRRFFDNDTLAPEGDTTTTVVRALAFVAAPGLMFAFFLQPKYGSYDGRPYWAMVSDHYFFVLDALVTMGLVAVFEWEMLFPDQIDFLVLSPLPVRHRTMLGAKAAALGQMLGLFLLSTTVFGTLFMPMLAVPYLWMHLLANLASTVLAGSFAALLVLAVGGTMLCVLDAGTFRRMTALVQMTMVLGWALLLFLYPLAGHFMRQITERPDWMRWLPPFWFLGVYERMLGSDGSWVFAMSREGMRALEMVAAAAAVTYPLAWARKRRMAIENTAARGVRRLGPLSSLLFYAGARRAEERAVFGFIGQVLARNQRYRIYMSLYAGGGLALTASCVMIFRETQGALHVGVSHSGLNAVMPMLLFWLMSGLRTAFAFPLNLQAAWVFSTSGVSMERCVAAARRWALLCGLVAAGGIAAALWMAGLGGWAVMVQAVCGASLVVVLADVFFAFRQGVPFTRARMPGKSSLPLMMAMYLIVFPTVVTSLADYTLSVEAQHHRLWMLPAIALGVHLLWRERLRRETYWDEEEEMEGTLTLGLVER